MQTEKRSALVERTLVPALLLLLVSVYYALRFRPGSPVLPYFEDDYFYYLKAAQNLVAGHGSSFDGAHLTNGYHPLWFLTTALLAALFDGNALFYVLTALMVGGVLATYLVVNQCFALYLSPRNARCFAFLVAVQAMMVMTGGMEVVLAVPMIASVCLFRMTRFRWTLAGGVLYGLLASAAVLSRLDGVLFVTALLLLDLVLNRKRPPSELLRSAIGVLVGLLPVALYLVINLYFFHMATPVSGAAKQLRWSHRPDTKAADLFFHAGWPILAMFARPVFEAAIVAAGFLVVRGRSRLSADHLPVVWALLLFPFLQLGMLSILSDWAIWDWYLYSFVIAGIGAILVLGSREELSSLPFRGAVGVAALLVSAGMICKMGLHEWRFGTRVPSSAFNIFHAAEKLAQFSEDRPGIYAMGDRSGTVGYLMHQPVIQLEGLMMDKPFLENIRQQRNLLDVLQAYDVRYYVATDPVLKPAVDGVPCFAVREPFQAGPTSPAMQATFCRQPVLAFAEQDTHTYIFDMKK